MNRAALSIWGVVLALGLGGCLGGGDDEDAPTIHGGVATVYSSAPRQGVSARVAEEVLAGERRALEERGGRVGGLRIRLRELPATDTGEQSWDPDLVAENASRAADDPEAIAYLGELDYGASAVSLPITNDAGLLHVSPGDGLTSLTRRPPGRPRAGPERYYPSERRTFVRVGPTDLSEAEALVARLESLGARRLALVFGREIYGRELAAQVVELARDAGIRLPAAEEYRDSPDDIPDIAAALAERRPDAVVHVAVAGRGSARLLAAIGEALPGVPILATSGLLADPDLALRDPRGSLEVVGPALSPERAGYEAMRLVLDAVAEGGPDRLRVIAAARRLAPRVSADGLVLYRAGEDGRLERAGRLP